MAQSTRKLGELLCRTQNSGYLLSCIVECNIDVLQSFTLDVQLEKHCCHQFVAYFLTSESSLLYYYIWLLSEHLECESYYKYSKYFQCSDDYVAIIKYMYLCKIRDEAV